jgi:hypothetical protein
VGCFRRMYSTSTAIILWRLIKPHKLMRVQCSSILLILTVFNLAAVCLFLMHQNIELVWDQVISEQEAALDPGRNERSTPREFVLPSTAAVAEAQESKHLSLEGINHLKCLQVLRARGHEILSDALTHNVDLARALVSEQKKIGMKASTKLDRVIAEELGCLNG